MSKIHLNEPTKELAEKLAQESKKIRMWFYQELKKMWNISDMPLSLKQRGK